MPRKRRFAKRQAVRELTIPQLLDLAFVGVCLSEFRPGTFSAENRARDGWTCMDDVRQSWKDHRDEVTVFCQKNDPRRIPWAMKRWG